MTTSEPLRILSLGAGVQSSTLALMMARGEIEAVDAAIFADTQAEPAEVYNWLDWLEKELPFPVYRVTRGSLEKAALTVRTSKTSGNAYVSSTLPAFLLHENGTKGLLGRQCTRDFKIAPVTRQIRHLLGRRSIRGNEGVLVRQAIGISRDEAHRMKPSRLSWIEHHWPLVDAHLTRNDCLDWMTANGYPEPPRSACVFCPFHSDREWTRLRDDHPNDFQRSVAFEESLQTAVDRTVMKGRVFLHSSLRPLSEVAFDDRPGREQLNLFGNECEGLCGV